MKKRSFLVTCLSLVAAQAPSVGAPAVNQQTISGKLNLVRYDMPIGHSGGYAPTRQTAKRLPGPDAVEWPELTLDGKPIFQTRANEIVDLPVRQGKQAMPLFQQPYDHVIEPGNHWFRAMDWRWNRRHIYTADRTARCSNAGEGYTGHTYELWTFPVLIRGAGDAEVRKVSLKVAGRTIYQKDGPWRSLTLLLPQSDPDKPYELTVNGQGAVTFHAGLQPVTLGDPKEALVPVRHTVSAGGSKITVTNLPRPETFPHQKAWEEDVAALSQPLPKQPAPVPGAGALGRYLGADVPRSPLTIYATALPHGMSSGFFQHGGHGLKPFPGTAEEYAAYLADTGYDAVFDPVRGLSSPDGANSFENRAVALGRRGVKLGLQYDNNWDRPALQHSNVAFFSHTLPDWHAPLYRSLQLAAQRFERYPNFLGISTGADNAGYVSFWHWAPPIPDRPWGEALVPFLGQNNPKVPLAPSHKTTEAQHEFIAPDQAAFVDYVQRYDETFRQYGYFARAVREVNPALVYTTGSFGSSPGGGGRGGWPWASMPGREMHEGLNVQQAYDWNEQKSSKPVHNVALVDRLRSYHPAKTTWSLIDDFVLHFDRQTRQRTYALVLTRGVQGVGTTFLPNPTGPTARPDVIADQKELYAWIRRYGGVYAMTEPAPAIGILYVHHQALLRRVGGGAEASEEQLAQGSHEGKTTEVLFLCHAAGWPARIITPEELKRGLPPGMKAVLLVGLNQFDDSWVWHEGLKDPLQRFAAGGGRILLDHESVSPVKGTATGMKVAAYVTQTPLDQTPVLLGRNRDNLEKLRAAMEGVAKPVAASGDPTVWAVPARAGDTLYVTAVNQAMRDADTGAKIPSNEASVAGQPVAPKESNKTHRVMRPQTGALTWNTDRPIYDVRLGRQITKAEAATVDLNKDAFRWYALPPAPVTRPAVAVAPGPDGFYRATVTIKNGQPMRGIPVRLTVSKGNDAAAVYSATGLAAKLPLRNSDAPGAYTVTATELLSGLSGAATVRPAGKPEAAPAPAEVRRERGPVLSQFTQRKNVPLTIALTPQQASDPKIVALADRLVAFYRGQGRKVEQGRVEPDGVVVSLQPHKTPQRYPQWKTIDSDLVLLGSAQNNVLLRDQARGYLLRGDENLAPGQAAIRYTRSPFVGEFDAVNLIAGDVAGLTASVEDLTSGAVASLSEGRLRP